MRTDSAKPSSDLLLLGLIEHRTGDGPLHRRPMRRPPPSRLRVSAIASITISLVVDGPIHMDPLQHSNLPCPAHSHYEILLRGTVYLPVNMNSGASKTLNAQASTLELLETQASTYSRTVAPTVGSARALRPLPFPGLAWRATVCIERGTLRGLRACACAARGPGVGVKSGV